MQMDWKPGIRPFGPSPRLHLLNISKSDVSNKRNNQWSYKKNLRKTLFIAVICQISYTRVFQVFFKNGVFYE